MPSSFFGEEALRIYLNVRRGKFLAASDLRNRISDGYTTDNPLINAGSLIGAMCSGPRVALDFYSVQFLTFETLQAVSSRAERELRALRVSERADLCFLVN